MMLKQTHKVLIQKVWSIRRHLVSLCLIIGLILLYQMFFVLTCKGGCQLVGKRQRKLSTMFVPGIPKSVIILAYQRTGSTFLGQIFNSNPAAFYMFEPLDALYSTLYGTRPGYNVPSDITSFPNCSSRSVSDVEKRAVPDYLHNLLSCNYDRLPTEFLTHHFWFLFRKEQKVSQNYINCLKAINRSSVSSCSKDVHSYCGSRFGERTPERQLLCNRLLTDPDYLSAYQEPTVRRIFADYRSCTDSYRRKVDAKCTPLLVDACSQRQLRAVKLVRATMDSMESLLISMPNLRVIHLVRDPRAVVFSRNAFGTSARGSCSNSIHSSADLMVAEAMLYCRHVTADIRSRRDLERRYPGRIFVVSYEDFVLDPVRYTGDIYRFLDETLPEVTVTKMKELAVKGNRHLAANKLAARWQKHLTYDVVSRIMSHCPELVEFVDRSMLHLEPVTPD